MFRRTVRLAVCALALTACKSTEEAVESKDAQAVAIDVDVPDTCQACHATVYAEWTSSMHAQAHHSKDPIYAAVRKVRMKKEGPELAAMCSGCHHPRAVEAPEGPVAHHGVSCASCHAVAAVAADARGAKAFTWTKKDALLGPHDPSEAGTEVHATGPAPAHMKDGSSLCLACHGELKGASGVPVCTTGPEWAKAGEGGQTCVDCHMPEVEGPSGQLTQRKSHRSHAFLGPRGTWAQPRLEFVATGVKLTGAFEGPTLGVQVENLSQHAMPSGFPGRVAALVVIGFDAKGQEAWRSSPTLFNKVYHDAEGKPTLAPYAKALVKDSRLEPGETRKLTFAPPKNVTRVEVRFGYRLLPPPLAKKLRLDADPLAGMKPVTRLLIGRPSK